MKENKIQNTARVEVAEKSSKMINEKPGRPKFTRKIKPKHEKKFIKQIIEKTPKELKLLDDELWTSQAVNRLIPQVKRRTINYYLCRWGITAQFPKEKKDINFDNTKEFDALVKEISEQKGEIHWLDKKTCTLELDQKEIKINIISSVTKKKKLRFMLYEQNFNDMIFIEFLKRLIQSSDRKVYLILNDSSLITKKVNEWANEHKNQINLHVTEYYN